MTATRSTRPPTAWPTPASRVAAVIGDPIEHSLSPLLHNAAFAARELDWAFLAFRVARGDAGAALDGARALGLEGLSVTMPHKEDVARLVSRCSPTASALGAVNTVVRRRDALEGENTDGDGFLDSLREDAGFDPAGRSCLVVGAGGAGRAVVLALATAGARRVVVVNRSSDRARRAAALAGGAGSVGSADEAGAADLVVNATPLGLGGTSGSPLDAACLGSGQIVVDLVYHPLLTDLLRGARERGATAIPGIGMLVHQAARAFTMWTGEPAPLEAMRAALDTSLPTPPRTKAAGG